MSDAATAKNPPVTKPAPPAEPDLSHEIERAIGREPKDRVKCVRVFGDYYRCNWWSPVIGHIQPNRACDFGVLSTHHVRKSRFLNVTANSGELLITEVER